MKAERLPVKIYTVADGLLRDDVRLIQVLFEDSDETLWIGTADGLYKLKLVQP